MAVLVLVLVILRVLACLAVMMAVDAGLTSVFLCVFLHVHIVIKNLQAASRSSLILSIMPSDPPALTHSLHPQYRIGQAASLSGVSAANIRHYEREGLLPSAVRAENQYRYYSDADVHALRLIRVCRSMNMSLEEVAQVMAFDGQQPQDCQRAMHTIEAHLGHVNARLQELQALAAQLEQLLAVCNGQAQSCHLIEALHQLAERLPTANAAAPGAKPRHV